MLKPVLKPVSKPVRILGVDPGSRLTGYGCVEVLSGRIRLVTHGTLRLETPSVPSTMAQRLHRLYEGLTELIREHRPGILVVENVFFAKNALSALKLGQARGVVLLASAAHGLELHEYNPTEVKKSIAGYGQADKDQVARVLQIILGKQTFATADASDGLALCVYHALGHVMGAAAAPRAASAPRKSASRRGSLADAVRHKLKG